MAAQCPDCLPLYIVHTHMHTRTFAVTHTHSHTHTQLFYGPLYIVGMLHN